MSNKKLHETATIRTVAKGGTAPCGSIVLSPFSLNVSYQEKDSLLESERYILIPDSNVVDTFFLLMLLQEKKSQMKSLKVGTTVKIIPRREIKNLSFKIPSLIEQKRISQIFQSFENFLCQESIYLKNLEQLKKGLLQALFPAEGESVPQWRFPEFHNAGNWITGKLENFARVITEKNKTQELIDFVSTENLLPNFGGALPVRKPIIKSDSSATMFLECDILVSKIRTYLKKIWLSDRKGCADSEVTVFRPLQVKSEFLFFLLTQGRFIDYLNSGAKVGCFPRTDANHMTKYNLCVPSKDEQETITECLFSLAVMIREKKKGLERVRQLQKGLRKNLIQNKILHA